MIYLTTLHPKALNDLPSLESIDLSDNRSLTTLHTKAFSNLPLLESIDLSRTGISMTIEEVKLVFVDLPKLKNIYLKKRKTFTGFDKYIRAVNNYDLS